MGGGGCDADEPSPRIPLALGTFMQKKLSHSVIIGFGNRFLIEGKIESATRGVDKLLLIVCGVAGELAGMVPSELFGMQGVVDRL